MKEFLETQKKFLNETFLFLKQIDSDTLDIKKNGKWSVKEVIGHLIDSASNNHQRFIRAQFKDDLIFEGYDQDEWIVVQNYNSSDWNELINCWVNFNFIIINSVSNISVEILKKERSKHNLDKIAWQTVSQNDSTTLEHFIKDYYGHLKHHVKQIKKIINEINN